MVSIKTIAGGLSRQIESAIEGKADAVQSGILCKSVDSIIKLARLQIEMGSIDWETSNEKPVIEMEPQSRQISANSILNNGQMKFTPDNLSDADDDDITSEIKRFEVELSHHENAMTKAAEGSGDFSKAEKHCKRVRKYIRDLRDELESR